MKRSPWLLTFAAAAALLRAVAAPCEEGRPPTVAVLPFQVFNAPDVAPSAPGLQAALASRLSGPGYRVLTPGPGEEGEADWTVRTSLTRLGSRMTLDAALEPAAGGVEGRHTFQVVDSVDALLPALEAVAAALKPALAPVPAPPSPAPSPAAPSAAATPAPSPPAATAARPAAPVAEQAAPVPAPAPGAGGGSELGQAFLRYRTVGQVDGEVRDLAALDADRDGAAELLALFDDRLTAFRDDGAALKAIWEVPLASFSVAAVLSSGDVDGDGTPEVFVAGLDGGRVPLTRVFQWSGGALAERSPPLNAFARVVPHPRQGDQLLAMMPGLGKDLFGPKQFAFSWDGRGYVKGDSVSLPMGVSVVNLDWVPAAGGESLLVATTQADMLRVYDAQGRKIYQSDDRLKGSSTILIGEERPRDEGDIELLRVQPRTLVWKGPDGVNQLLLHKNHGTIARMFTRSVDFTHGQWLAYRWDGLALLLTADGPKLPGYFNSLELGPAPGRPGRQTLYTALVQSEGVLLVKRSTRLLAVDL